MNGLSFINAPDGRPSALTIDLDNHDPAVNPLLNALLALIEQQTDDAERREFLYASGILANRAYGDDEPEYTDAHLIERNPNYRPK